MGFLQNFNKKMVQIAAHDPQFQIPASSPLYPKKESGVCLIVGTHPCVDDDIDHAMLVYPDARVCGVNEAGGLVPCDHLATCHPEKLEYFKSLYEWDPYVYPDEPAYHVQSREPVPGAYTWTHNVGAGSALFAAVAMLAIGYDMVILCGCPLNGGGGYALKTFEGSAHDPRIGEMDAKHSMIEAWQYSINTLISTKPDIAKRIRSMSGFTKSAFGGI